MSSTEPIKSGTPFKPVEKKIVMPKYGEVTTAPLPFKGKTDSDSKPLTKEEYIRLSEKAHKEMARLDREATQKAHREQSPNLYAAGEALKMPAKILGGIAGLFSSCSSIDNEINVVANQDMKVNVKPTQIISKPDTVYIDKPIITPGDTVYIKEPIIVRDTVYLPGKEIEIPTFPDYNPPVNKLVKEMITELTGKELGDGVLVNGRGFASWEKNAAFDSDLKIFNSSDGSMVFGVQYMYRDKDTHKYEPGPNNRNLSYARMQFSENVDGTITMLMEDAVPLKDKPKDETQINQYQKLVLSRAEAKKYLAQLVGADGSRTNRAELTPDPTEAGTIAVKNTQTGAVSWFSGGEFTVQEIKKGDSPEHNPEWK